MRLLVHKQIIYGVKLSPTTNWVIKSREMLGAWHVGRTGHRKRSHMVLASGRE
jgi:hypothetical protein